MENTVNTSVIENTVVDPNAQLVTFDGGHQPLANPSAQIVTSDGGWPTVGHGPSIYVLGGHTVIG